MGKRKLGVRKVGVKRNGPSKAKRKATPTSKPGAGENGTGLIDGNLKDPHVDDTNTNDSGHRPASAIIALPIMTPHPAGGGDWACGVDYNRTEYTIKWSGTWQPPCLLGFPDIQDLTIQEAYQSNVKRRCWQQSTMLDYGSYAYVRILDKSCRHPVLKIAHQGDAKRHFISREFETLQLLKIQPVVGVQAEPIADEDGLFGFYMQKLCKINRTELAERLDELKDAIERVHEAGIAINDVSISNVMLDAQDNITLIDFGFAGRIGEKIPSFFPPWKSRRALFSVETDNEAFEEICKICRICKDC